MTNWTPAGPVRVIPDTRAPAYRDALDQIIPVAGKPHRSKARKRALYLAGRGEYGAAKFYALRLGADPAHLLSLEMLLFGMGVIAYHPDPRHKHWRGVPTPDPGTDNPER